MGFAPFVTPVPSGALIAAALAGQTVPGALTLTGNLNAQGGGFTGSVTTSAGSFSATGGIVDVATAGQGLRVAEGANAKQGTAVLVAGTATVANTSVTANSRIFLTAQVLGTVSAASGYAVTARTPGTSFTITASVVTDTSTIAYEIFEPG